MTNTKDQKVLFARRTLAQDISQVEEHHKIRVEKFATIEIIGDPGLYKLTDLNDGNKIGEVTLRTAEFYPGDANLIYHRGELPEKIEDMLQTPRFILKRLIESNQDLYVDINHINTNFGIHCYKPTALSLEERIPNGKKQILIVTTEFFGKDSYNSSKEIGTVAVNVSEYVPGRRNYPEERIYHVGELKRTILEDDELVLAYLERVLHNAQHQYPASTPTDWKKTAKDFRNYLANSFRIVGQ